MELVRVLKHFNPDCPAGMLMRRRKFLKDWKFDPYCDIIPFPVKLDWGGDKVISPGRTAKIFFSPLETRSSMPVGLPISPLFRTQSHPVITGRISGFKPRQIATA